MLLMSSRRDFITRAREVTRGGMYCVHLCAFLFVESGRRWALHADEEGPPQGPDVYLVVSRAASVEFVACAARTSDDDL